MKKVNFRNIVLYLDKKRIITLRDDKYLKLLYKKFLGKDLNLENPKTFNEKLQWLKLHDRNPQYTNFVDKYEVRKYIKEKIGEEYLIPILGIYDKFEDIDFDNLPNQFVIKCTHDSGGIIICKDKNTFNKKEAKNKIKRLLKQNFYYLAREWPYKNVKPRIMIEKYMKEDGKEDLTDYKFMVFNGKVKCSFVCLNRTSKKGMNIDFYDREWKKMPFYRHYKNSNTILDKPKNYDLMIQISEKLAKGMPFVRVDLYEISGKIYFGELTLYPGAGLEEFNPEKWDEILGSWIKIDEGRK